jgi:protein phosphatase
VLSSIDVCRNDTLILCSDGLSGLVKAEEIRQVVDSYGDEVEACRRLIDMANERGGYDNITVIVARFTGDSLPAASEEDLIQYTLFDDSEETTKMQGLPAPLPAEKKTP